MSQDERIAATTEPPRFDEALAKHGGRDSLSDYERGYVDALYAYAINSIRRADRRQRDSHARSGRGHLPDEREEAARMSEAYEGWAVVELMGHRRLGGYVRQAEQFGVAMLRLDVPEHPWNGGCTCGSDDPESLDHEKHNSTCQMFRAEDDDEIKDVYATQFYGGASIYCLTPASEEAARAVATHAKPTPVQSWELPRPALPPAEERYVPEDEYARIMEGDEEEPF